MRYVSRWRKALFEYLGPPALWLLPARFLLVAAMNPCPCGEGSADGHCRCSDAARARYSRRLSGPLLDRFDLRLEVRPPAADVLLDGEVQEPSCQISDRVRRARQRALGRGVRCNADLPAAQLDEVAPLSPGARSLLRQTLGEWRPLPVGGYAAIRTVARTIADLKDEGELLSQETVQAALSLRQLPETVLGVAR